MGTRRPLSLQQKKAIQILARDFLRAAGQQDRFPAGVYITIPACEIMSIRRMIPTPPVYGSSGTGARPSASISARTTSSMVVIFEIPSHSKRYDIAKPESPRS